MPEQYREVASLIAEASAAFTLRAGGPAGLSAFRGGVLTPAEFKRHAKSSLNLLLTLEQCELVVEWLGQHGGVIEGGRFLVYFMRLGGHEKRQRATAKFKQTHHRMTKQAEKEERKTQRIMDDQQTVFSEIFSPEDLKAVQHLLGAAAFK